MLLVHIGGKSVDNSFNWGSVEERHQSFEDAGQ